jgi:hypothetical protein
LPPTEGIGTSTMESPGPGLSLTSAFMRPV